MKTSKHLGQGIACDTCGAMLMRDAQFEGDGAFNIRCAKCLSLWKASITKKTIITLTKIAIFMLIIWTSAFYLTNHPQFFAYLLD